MQIMRLLLLLVHSRMQIPTARVKCTKKKKKKKKQEGPSREDKQERKEEYMERIKKKIQIEIKTSKHTNIT